MRVKIPTYFCHPDNKYYICGKENENPLDLIGWRKVDLELKNTDGDVVFKMDQVEVPSFWSDSAALQVASKYFRKGTETSVRQLIERVVRFFMDSAEDYGYSDPSCQEDIENLQRFGNELRYILVHQYAFFNSPVWFNCGLYNSYHIDKPGIGNCAVNYPKKVTLPGAGEVVTCKDQYSRPQGSACFILNLEDSLDDIFEKIKVESRLFKFGSGSGINVSKLREKGAKLSGGGQSSGVMSFLKVFDSGAGVIKSGGVTRRAATMRVMDIDHPDIVDFIGWKAKEELKIRVLLDSGYGDPNNPNSFETEAHQTVSGQNSNNSVRIPNSFMQKVVERDPEACRLFNLIAEAAHDCADPGIHFQDSIEASNNLHDIDEIYASNPCVTGDTLIFTSKGLIPIVDLVDTPTTVLTKEGPVLTSGSFFSGNKPVWKLTTKSGYSLRLTEDHLVLTDRGYVKAKSLTTTDKVYLADFTSGFGQENLDPEFSELIGGFLGDGCVVDGSAVLTLGKHECGLAETWCSYLNGYKKFNSTVRESPTSLRISTSDPHLVARLREYAVLDKLSDNKALTDRSLTLSKQSTKHLLRGLFQTDGTVANYSDKSQYIALDSTSVLLLEQVQLLLLKFGIKSKLYSNRRNGKTRQVFPGGTEYTVKEMFSLRVSKTSRVKFESEIGFVPGTDKALKLAELNKSVSTYTDVFSDTVKEVVSVSDEVVPVYDITVPGANHFFANGICVHNCSEYLSINNSACNLASINLVKFINDTFGDDLFQTVRVLIVAMDILVSASSYPTAEIAENANKYRQLGLGITNLGSLLMRSGVPYDSDEGRRIAQQYMRDISLHSYSVSSELAKEYGSFFNFENCRDRVLTIFCDRFGVNDNDEYQDGVYSDIAVYGLRNAQLNVIAPTGTISFAMDCDTTSLEPDFALVKYKTLAGGGEIKLVNYSVVSALKELGYSELAIEKICKNIGETGSVVGSGVSTDHYPVFATAVGDNSISPDGHLKMLAALQKYVDMGISKTINLPNNVTVEDIKKVYFDAWELGVKCVSVYRDGCKVSQPLSALKSSNTEVKNEKQGTTLASEENSLNNAHEGLHKPVRVRSADKTTWALRHNFEIKDPMGYVSGYFLVGLYKNRAPEDLFIMINKGGSTVMGLASQIGMQVSLSLQYGVPLPAICKKLIGESFPPSGWTDNPDIPRAASLSDYLGRFLEHTFLLNNVKVSSLIEDDTWDEEEEDDDDFDCTWCNEFVEDISKKEKAFIPGDTCRVCGSLMIQTGTCKSCVACGTSSGGCG